jgi:hypothetical protein
MASVRQLFRSLAPLPMLAARNPWKAAENDRRDHCHRLPGGQPAAGIQRLGFPPLRGALGGSKHKREKRHSLPVASSPGCRSRRAARSTRLQQDQMAIGGVTEHRLATARSVEAEEHTRVAGVDCGA